MRTITIEMSSLSQCEVVTCGYNSQGGCHAKAITVGKSAMPACDTFFTSAEHAAATTTAGVGACKVSGCTHNRDFECAADSIKVGLDHGQALCRTFEPKQ